MVPISTPLVKEFLAVRAIRAVRVIAQGDIFLIGFQIGMEERILEAQRGGERQFKTLDAAARYLKGLGIVDATLNLTHMEAKQASLL